MTNESSSSSGRLPVPMPTARPVAKPTGNLTPAPAGKTSVDPEKRKTVRSSLLGLAREVDGAVASRVDELKAAKARIMQLESALGEMTLDRDLQSRKVAERSAELERTTTELVQTKRSLANTEQELLVFRAMSGEDEEAYNEVMSILQRIRENAQEVIEATTEIDEPDDTGVTG